MKRTNVFKAFCSMFIFIFLVCPAHSYSNCTSLLKEVNVTTDGAKNIVLSSFTGNFTVTGGGNINVYDFKSTVIALTDGGNIFLSGSNAAVNVSTGGGNIDLDYTGKN